MKNSNLHIICATHKPSVIPSLSYIHAVQVGASASSWISDILKDNEGDNISEKNSSYNEITALYWAWRNKVFADTCYFGLCHYRRFFIASRTLFSEKGIIRYKDGNSSFLNKTDDLPERVKQILEKGYDLIIAKPSFARNKENKKISIEDQYAHWHCAEDWDALRTVIKKYQPQYENSFDEYSSMLKFNQLNMFIGKRTFLDSYMPWLMSILEPLESMILKKEDPYQNRAIGFLAERLLGLYIHHHKLKTYWLPVAFIE